MNNHESERLAAVLAGVIALLAGCAGDRDREDAIAHGPTATPVGADWSPGATPMTDYVGAEACSGCHADAYAAWVVSPHGRAMAHASPSTVKAPFDGRDVQLDDGNGLVRPLRVGDDLFMEIEGTRHAVDLVLASGRQQQVFLSQLDDGTYKLLPLFWSTRASHWIATSAYQGHGGGQLGAGPAPWKRNDLVALGCADCHLSQRHFVPEADADRGSRLRWIDLSINCESCHGPGAAHVASRRDGASSDPYRNLDALSQQDDADLCGTCHAMNVPWSFGVGDDGLPDPRFPATLRHPFIRPDGTQRNTTYQLSGHLVSECYRQGAMACLSCHGPHALDSRDLIGQSAEGAHSNRQCDVCHRDKGTAEAAVKHSKHPATIRCVDCHMSESWIMNTPARQQRTSDHSISIPRPRESMEFGTPNACTTCHAGETNEWALRALQAWGQWDATNVRSWVATVFLGRRGDSAAAAGLLELVESASTGDYLLATALDLIQLQALDPSWLSVVEQYPSHANPLVRASALRALSVHDPDDSVRWRRVARSDTHAYVRLIGFDTERDPRNFTARELERARQDIVAHLVPPALVDWLLRLSSVHAIRGDYEQGASALREAARFAQPGDLAGVEAQRRKLSRMLQR